MTARPRHIDLPSTPPEPFLQPLFTPHGELTPPQTGTIPPALSPLDAFALQGRLLAKRFHEESRDGRRLSRLPHHTIQNEFARPRPAYVHSPRHEMPSFGFGDSSPDDATPKGVTEVRPDQRPMSMHPLIHAVGPESFHHRLSSVDEADQELEPTYFDYPRPYSPDARDNASVTSAPYIAELEANPVHTSAPSFSLPVRPVNTSNLAAPSPGAGRSSANSPSIRSVMEDLHTEDVEGLSLGGSVESFNVPKAPASPFRPPMGRSPSMTSERSVSSAGMSRPSLNYSRPLSRATNASLDLRRAPEGRLRQDSNTTASTRPSLEVPGPCRSDSFDSPNTPYTYDAPHTPVSISSNEFFPNERPSFERPSFDGPITGSPSTFTYAKYSLPRGKSVNRESLGIEEMFNRTSALIDWDERREDRVGSPTNVSHGEPPALPSPAFGNRRGARPADIAIPRPSTETQSSPRLRRQRSRPSSPTTTISDASTIKARSAHNTQPSQEMTAEMNFERGIECHESGSLQKSTYYFRLAARAGHSDAMLLYALACRHGWGMRPSPAEAVVWLQKAVDSAQLTVAEDEKKAKQNKPVDYLERSKHKAQFALGVYELGMSYSKGWGVKQNKPLALRCFEVAGSWGDADALAEAGFCYAEGIGAKKDMKKAAGLYRQAEAKGMSMAGNSWIHKDKYKDTDEGGAEPVTRRGRSNTMASTTSKKTAREKSRTRSFFRKKSVVSAQVPT